MLIIAILAGGSSAAAQVGHTSLPSAPGQAGTLEPLTQFDSTNPVHMVTDGRYAYVAAWLNGAPGVLILDIIDPAHPLEIASFPFDNIDYSLLAATDGVLYVSKAGDGILVYDVSIPTNPVLASHYEPIENMSVSQMTISDNHAYLADYSLGLIVLDISNPLQPVVVGLNNEEGISRLEVQDHYAYALRTSELIIYDISNPAQPILVGRYSHPSHSPTEAFTVSGSYLYINGNCSGIASLN